MNPFKNRLEKKPKQKPQWAYSIAYIIAIIMLVFWLVNIFKPADKSAYEDNEPDITALVDSTIKAAFPHGEVSFRAEPAKITYEQVPDEAQPRYDWLKENLEYLQELPEITEDTQKAIMKLQQQLKECGKTLNVNHDPNEIHFIVQKVKINLGDTATVHAFAKVKPDYSDCELEVTNIIRNADEDAMQKQKQEIEKTEK